MLIHSCCRGACPRSLHSLHKPALSSWSNGDRTMRCACRSLQNVTDMTNSSLAPLYRSRRGVFLQSHAPVPEPWQNQTRDAALRARSRLARGNNVHETTDASGKNPQHALLRSWLAQNCTRRPRAAACRPIHCGYIPPCLHASHCAHSCRRCCKRSGPRGHRLPGP